MAYEVKNQQLKAWVYEVAAMCEPAEIQLVRWFTGRI